MQYVKRQEIRRGPGWVVWRGEHPETRQLFTIKEVTAPAAEAKWLLEQLRQEYDFLAAFDHPRLLKPVRFDAESGRAVFEDAQCGLAQYLRERGPLSPTLVANVLLQCAEGLEQLHAKKKGHGAVSTHTVLVGPRGDVKLGDFLGYEFGAAAALPAPDFAAKYQAPELVDSSLGICSPSSDLYCLGYLALELLAGEQFARFFGAAGDANWLGWHADPAKTLEDWRGALYHAPGGLLDIIAGLIEKDPAKRAYTSAAPLRAALEGSRLTSGQPLPPPREPARARRPARRPSLTLFSPGRPSGQTFAPGRPVFVGRAQECDVRLTGPSVSRKHALLLCEPDGRWWVHDVGSRRGTRVNGTEVSLAELHDGDEVRFGDRRCRVRLTGAGMPPRRVLGGFELCEKIHEGAGGEVYRAVWVAQDGREAAVRVYPGGFQTDELGIKRFMRGIPGAAKMRHPNVVQLYRGGFLRRGAEHVWFLAMEYLPGGSLRDRVKGGGPLPVGEVVRYGLDIARALDPAAERGLVHRNVTPSCILFDAAGVAKLGDFSLLRGGALTPTQELTQAALPPGEHVYQAPEQLLGTPNLTPACDVYSLAATMYEALTGEPPFPRDLSWMALVRSICSRPVRPPRELNPAISPALDALLVRALEKAPEARFATPREFRRALRAATVSARTPEDALACV